MRTRFFVFTLFALLAQSGLFSASPAFAKGESAAALSLELEHCLGEAILQQKPQYTCIGTIADACMREHKNQNTTGMAQCNYEEAEAWDRLLNRYYQRLRAGGAYPRLQDIQKAWISYRDQKCAFFEEFFQGGSMALFLRANCLRQETARRVIDLHFFYLEVEGR